MKTIHDIKYLLNLFYEGETTTEQENELKQYFSQTNVADDLKDDQLIFNSIFETDTNEIKVPDTLEHKINDTILDLESKNKVIPITTKPAILLPIAAAVTLLFGFGLYSLNQKTEKAPTLSQVEKNDLLKAQQALILLSEQYNKGLNELEQTQEKLSESTETLNKSIKTIMY